MMAGEGTAVGWGEWWGRAQSGVMAGEGQPEGWQERGQPGEGWRERDSRGRDGRRGTARGGTAGEGTVRGRWRQGGSWRGWQKRGQPVQTPNGSRAWYIWEKLRCWIVVEEAENVRAMEKPRGWGLVQGCWEGL